MTNNSEIQWRTIVSATEGFSGSDLSNLMRHALSIPLIELQGNNMWKIGRDGCYEPATSTEEYSDYVITCDVTDLPPRLVRAREVTINDMLTALTYVKRTVEDEDIQKFTQYSKR